MTAKKQLRASLWLLSTAVLLAGLSLRADTVAPKVAWIDHFDGMSADYTIVHESQSFNPRCCWAPLYAGDSIAVHREGVGIYVTFGGEKPMKICLSKKTTDNCDQESPFIVQAANPPSLFSSLMQWGGDYLTGWSPRSHPGREKDLKIKGSGITSELLAARKVQIGSGDRKLSLSWSGGTAPYKVMIYTENRRVAVLSLEAINERQFVGSAVHLQVGQYVLEIVDSDGQKLAKTFNAVDSPKIPVDPEIARANLSTEMRNTIYAVWLAGLDEALWVWEAYLRASELAPVYPPAQVLSDALRAGALPPSRFRPASKIGSSSNEDKPQLVVQLGHSTYVWSVAFSPDGRFILTGSADSTACLWDARTGQEIRHFRGHSASVEAATFSPDGQFVLTGSEDGTARIWDTATGRQLKQLETQSDISSVAFSPDGRWILTTGEDPYARLWEAATGQEVRRWHVRPDRRASAAFSPDGRLVLIRTYEDVALWDRESGNQILRFHVSAAIASPAAFSPDGRFLLAGEMDHGAILFDASSGVEIRRFEEASFSVHAVAFSPDGRFVLTGGGSEMNSSDPSWKDGYATVWNAATGRMIRHVVIPGSNSWGPDTTSSVAFSPDGEFFLTGSFDGLARLWKVDTGKVALRFENQASGITAIAVASDGQFLVTGGWDGVAHRWNLFSGQESSRFKGDATLVYSIAISPDGKSVLVGSAGNHTVLYDAVSGREFRRFDGPKATVESVAFSSDAHSVLSAVFDGTVRAWSIGSGEETQRIAAQRPPYAGAFSPDGLIFAAGMRGHPSSRDFTVCQWNTETGEEMPCLAGHSDDIESVAFSSDGRRIVTTSADQTARVWEVSTGREVRRFAAGSASRAAFSPDGASILTGSRDGTARLWDLETGNEVLRLQGHSSAIEGIAFSPDGRFIVTGSTDSTTRLWDRRTGEEICRLISFRDGTWVVVDPDGRFDTNNLEEIRGLSWILPRAPSTPLSLEIFMRDYYEPRLLPRLMSGEQFKAAQPLVGVNLVQPVIRIKVTPQSDPPDRVTVAVEVSRGTDPLTGKAPQSASDAAAFDLRLFRDGHLVSFAPRSEDDTAPGQLPLGPSGAAILTFPDIPLPHRTSGDPVVFSAYAFNSDRVKSQTARVAYRPAAPLRPVRGRAYIISFGVNYNDDSSLRLGEAASDARVMLHSLTGALERTNQFEKVVSVLMVSEDVRQDGGIVRERTATRENLHAVLDRLAGYVVKPPLLSDLAGAGELRKATPDDLIIIILSSHGAVNRDSGDFFIVPFLPTDISPNSRDYSSHLISNNDLSRWLRNVDAGELDMILDSCYSASAVESPSFKPGPMGSRGLGQLSYDKGMRILAATQADNVALESSNLGLGLLTYALVHDGLEREGADVDPKDGIITTAKWLRYGVERVPQIYQALENDELNLLVNGKPVPGKAVLTTARGDGAESGIQRPALFDFNRSHVETVLQRLH